MKLRNLTQLELRSLAWHDYDLVLLGCGFEERSTFVLQHIPKEFKENVVVLGFSDDMDKLSRPANEAAYWEAGLRPFVAKASSDYEELLLEKLTQCARRVNGARPIRLLVDYSVMTRAWYGYILTWLKYSTEPRAAEVDFVYAHGRYDGQFEPLRIQEICAIPGFEGVCVASRGTVAAFGLGFDRYAALAVHEQIEPDSSICFLAQESPNDEKTKRAIEENQEIIQISKCKPIALPLGNMAGIYRMLHEELNSIELDCEIVAVPMGPKTHVLGMLLVAQAIPRITCLHAKGYRRTPVQVSATGRVSAWRLHYAN